MQELIEPLVNPNSVKRLPRRVKSALDDFQKHLLELYPGDITQLILFGSYARGEAKSYSDLDVIVVVKWVDPDREGGFYLDNIVDPRWQTVLDTAVQAMVMHGGPFISPLVISDRLFESNLSVIEEAKKEGIILWKSQPT